MKKVKYSTIEFTNKDLPINRWKQYFYLLKNEWRLLLLVGLFILLFFIPYIAKCFFEEITLLNVASSIDASLSENEKYQILFYYQNIFYLLDIPCFIIASIAFAGLARVYKELAYDNGVSFKGDFIRGIKENAGLYLIISFLFSLLIYFIRYGFGVLSYQSDLNKTLFTGFKGLAFGVVFALIVPIFLFMLSSHLYYTLPFYQNFINSFRFSLHRYITTVTFLIILFLIFIASTISNFIIKLIFIIIIFFAILPLISLAWHLYALSIYDYNVNKVHYPTIYKKGLQQ